MKIAEALQSKELCIMNPRTRKTLVGGKGWWRVGKTKHAEIQYYLGTSEDDAVAALLGKTNTGDNDAQ